MATAMRLGLAVMLLSFVTSGCLRPPTPAEQVTDAARELNLAARFGRIDIASERASDAARTAFMERRRQWGSDLRVVDIDLSGLRMNDEEHAEVLVNVAWMRMAEGLLRNTVVMQQWSNKENGWQLTREKRVSGDVGLFGENVVVMAPEPHPDVQFPTRTIR
jgi:hypothetical protein